MRASRSRHAMSKCSCGAVKRARDRGRLLRVSDSHHAKSALHAKCHIVTPRRVTIGIAVRPPGYLSPKMTWPQSAALGLPSLVAAIPTIARRTILSGGSSALRQPSGFRAATVASLSITNRAADAGRALLKVANAMRGLRSLTCLTTIRPSRSVALRLRPRWTV